MRGGICLSDILCNLIWRQHDPDAHRCRKPSLRQALADHDSVVLQAPPSAGKTTRVPLALLNEPWLADQSILMLQPRWLAARAAAERMASELGEKVGETGGYRIRLESRVGPSTRIEVVTEGILARLLQDDPSLEGVGLVIFDEFHLRSLDSDLALALCLNGRELFRDDQLLKLLVMSATLERVRLSNLLGDAPVVTSEGRMFPVDTVWSQPYQAGEYIEPKDHKRVTPCGSRSIRLIFANICPAGTSIQGHHMLRETVFGH